MSAPVVIPPAGTEYDPRMGVPHVINGIEHDAHPGETCLARGDADAPVGGLREVAHALAEAMADGLTPEPSPELVAGIELGTPQTIEALAARGYRIVRNYGLSTDTNADYVAAATSSATTLGAETE